MKTMRFLGAALLILAAGCTGQGPERANEDLATDYDAAVHKTDSLALTRQANLMRLLRADTAEANAVLTKLGHYRDERCLRHDSLAGTESVELAAESDSTSTDLALSPETNEITADYDQIGLDCETTELASIESRDEFQDAVGEHLEVFDNELTDLRRSVLDSDALSERFDEVIDRLTQARNEVAVRIAETANSSDDDYPETKAELVSAMSRFDILLDVAETAVHEAKRGDEPNVF